MNTMTRLVLATLCLAVLLLPAAGLAQGGVMVPTEDIVKQLGKEPEPAPAPTGDSRSFNRGIRITSPRDGQAPAPAQAQQPEPSRDVAQAPPKEKPAVTVYIHFTSGAAELADDFSKKQVAAVGKALNTASLASARFEIGGHTDSLGSDALNQNLSEQRAAYIRDLLVNSHGVNAGRITAKGYGKSQPVASNDTEAGRAKNRRVVIKRLD